MSFKTLRRLYFTSLLECFHEKAQCFLSSSSGKILGKHLTEAFRIIVILQLIFVCNVVKYVLTLYSTTEVLINYMTMCS